MSVVKNRISTAKKTTNKTYESKSGVIKTRVVEGNGMYTFVYGNGSKKVSETRHMSESQANSYQEQLEKAGY